MEKDINKFTGDNLGGINSFKFCLAKEVESIPAIFNGAIHNAVILKTGARWYNGYCTKDTMYFKDEPQPSDHGAFHQKEFSGSVPGENEELVSVFEILKNEKLILDITYNSGTRKLIGNIDEPLFIQSFHDSKADFAGKNEYRLIIAGVGISRSPIYLI